MKPPTKPEFELLMREKHVSKRLIRELRYIPGGIDHASERDFLVVTTKSANDGVLMFDEIVVQFRLEKRRPNSSGRVEAIICDICATWQRGTNSAILSFKKSSTRTVSHLVCADLDCSLHVRDMTDASKLSRTQLRENILPEDRIGRLRTRLAQILKELI